MSQTSSDRINIWAEEWRQEILNIRIQKILRQSEEEFFFEAFVNYLCPKHKKGCFKAKAPPSYPDRGRK